MRMLFEMAAAVSGKHQDHESAQTLLEAELHRLYETNLKPAIDRLESLGCFFSAVDFKGDRLRVTIAYGEDGSALKAEPCSETPAKQIAIDIGKRSFGITRYDRFLRNSWNPVGCFDRTNCWTWPGAARHIGRWLGDVAPEQHAQWLRLAASPSPSPA